MSSGHGAWAVPRLSILSSHQLEELHLATLEVLSRTGVNVHHADAVEVLHKAGATVGDDGIRVRIPARLVRDAISSAPRNVILCDRNGQKKLDVGGDNVYFGPGPTTSDVVDFEVGERRPTLKQDVANTARVCDNLPNIDYVSSLALVSDCAAQVADVHEFEAMLLNTTKPIAAWSYGAQGCRDIVDMCLVVAGNLENLRHNPFVAFIIGCGSPLQHFSEGLERLLVASELGLPAIYIPAPSSGATAPGTGAGALVSANAEVLSGLVVHQLKRPGAPFIYGALLSIMDMSSGVLAYGAPELSLLTGGLAALSHYYSLPVFGTGGCTDSKLFDQQAAMEAAFSILMSSLTRANMVHDLGFLDGGLASSLDLLVSADAMAGMARRLLGGIRVNPETVALDVIDRVGPGGQFLTEEHTYHHFKENWTNRLVERRDRLAWEADGRQTMGDRTRGKIRQILATHDVEPLPEEARAAINQIVRRAEARVGGD